MKGRDKLFFNLLTFLMLVVIGLVGYQNYDVDKQIKRWERDIQEREARGMRDTELKQTVDKLEAELSVRLQETFDLDPDPLDLTRVIKNKDFLKRLGVSDAGATDNRMRLSCTALGGDTPFAIIKYRARSHVLTVGDIIGDYRVSSIGLNSIRLKRGGEVMSLKTEKSPASLAAEEVRYENRALPVVKVRQVPIETGNY